MKLLRAVYVASGQKVCHACGAPMRGPCEMYRYVDERGQEMDVCFGCRMFMVEGRTVDSYHKRNTQGLGT